VGAEAGEGGVDLLEDRLAGQALPAGTVVHLAVDLGGKDDVLAPGVPLDGAADEFLGRAGLVGVGGVPEGHAEFDGLLEERLGGLVVERPRVGAFDGAVAVAHASEGKTADLEPGRTESCGHHDRVL
jgi:hypothetical protein